MVGFSACSDKKNNGLLEDSIFGVWVYTASSYDGVKEEYEHDCSTKKDHLELKSTGELSDVYYDEKCVEELFKGTYTVAGNKITIKGAEIGEITLAFKLTGNSLILENEGTIEYLARK